EPVDEIRDPREVAGKDFTGIEQVEILQNVEDRLESVGEGTGQERLGRAVEHGLERVGETGQVGEVAAQDIVEQSFHIEFVEEPEEIGQIAHRNVFSEDVTEDEFQNRADQVGDQAVDQFEDA